MGKNKKDSLSDLAILLAILQIIKTLIEIFKALMV